MKSDPTTFLLLITCLVAAISCNSAGADTYPIDTSQTRVSIAPELYTASWIKRSDYATDNTRAYFDEVIRPGFEHQVVRGNASLETKWVKNPASELTLLLESNTTWVAVQLENPTDNELSVMLDMFGLGITSWYVVDGDGNVKQHSDDIFKPRAGRPVFDVSSVIPLKLEGKEVVQVYVGIFALDGARFRFDLWQEDAFRKDRLGSMMIDGLYFGLVGILVLLCLIVFVNIREPVYLFFGLFVLSCGATVFFGAGLGSLFLFEEYFVYGADFLFVSTGAVDLTAAIFSILLLRIHLTNPLLFKAWFAVILVNLANTYFAISVNQGEVLSVDRVSDVIATSITATLLEQIIYFWTLLAYWRSSKVARYWFLVVFTHSIMFILWSFLSVNPEASGFEAKRLIQAVTVFDAFVICLVLAYTYRIERSERLAAQELGVENLRLARDIEQAKANFISTVSHDLHGPVRAIGFFAESLRNSINEDGKLGLQRIEENVETVSALLDSLVRLSESESHHKLAIQQTELSRLLYTLKNEFDPVARAKGLTLSIPTSSLTVETDPVALSQVLRNLIENAIKYTDSGLIEVLVSERDGFVCITVSDSGRGIASSELSKVFEEFYQVSSRDSDGVGLGLSIVARLTQLLGIQVEVSSSVGKGSKFEILIPNKLEPTDRSNAPNSSYTAAMNLTGMVIDEGANSLQSILAQLADWGVTLVPEPASLDGVDFLIAPVDEYGAQTNAFKKTVVLVGEATGFVPPSQRHILIPEDVEPMKLRSITQRILKSNAN